VLIALAVLVLISVLLLRLARGTSEAPVQEAPPQGTSIEPATDVLILIEAAGDALIESGFDVTDVQSDLYDIARAYGMSETEIIALPTAVLVSTRTGGQLRTGAVASGRQRLRLHQIEALDEVVALARCGQIDPREALARIEAIRWLPPPFTPLTQLLGYVLATVGLAVLLGSSWRGVVVSAGLGALAGGLLLVGTRIPDRFRVLIIVATSFSVSLTVFLLLRTGLQFDVLPCLIAPLVTLLPGALLTTSVIELSTGEMISGAGRLAAGGAQLVLLGLGIVAAAALAGVPALQLATPEPALGLLGPWLAVACFRRRRRDAPVRPAPLNGMDSYCALCGLRRSGAWRSGVRRSALRVRWRRGNDPRGRSAGAPAHRPACHRQFHPGVLAPGARRARPHRGGHNLTEPEPVPPYPERSRTADSTP
jgi:uncharacterized membrane protein YjjP (DUF1212 family)